MNLFSFHPGETFVVQFLLPFHVNDVKAVVLSFRNKDRVVYEGVTTSIKAEDENQGEPIRVGYLFTQGETLLFEENSKFKLQLNVYGRNSSRVSSKEIDVVTKEQQIRNSGISRDASILEATYGSYNAPVISNSTGTTVFDYEMLTHKPMLNGVELTGDRTLPISITTEQIDRITSQERSELNG